MEARPKCNLSSYVAPPPRSLPLASTRPVGAHAPLPPSPACRCQVHDFANAVVNAMTYAKAAGNTYELAGPKVPSRSTAGRHPCFVFGLHLLTPGLYARGSRRFHLGILSVPQTHTEGVYSTARRQVSAVGLWDLCCACPFPLTPVCIVR